MKIHIAQQNYTVGDFNRNTSSIIEAIKEAEKEGAELIIFSELCVCGFPSEDLLLSEMYIDKVMESIQEIREHTEHIGVIIGAPERNASSEGKRLFNSAWFLFNKEILGTTGKAHLSDFGIFNQSRYFEPGDGVSVFSFKNKKIAITIGEDIYYFKKDFSSRETPEGQSDTSKPDLMINLSSTPFDYSRFNNRKSLLKESLQDFNIPLIYCNSAGANTGVILEGNSMAFDKDGNLCVQLSAFGEDKDALTLFEDGTLSNAVIEPNISESLYPKEPEHFLPSLNISLIRRALVSGIREYFSKLGLKKAIVGNSGGIDSAVTLTLACEALGKENVFALLMPSQYSSDHSISDGEQLCKNLNVPYKIIPIEPIFNSFIQSLKPVFNEAPADVTEENIQARIRSSLLMAAANKFNYVLLNTSNKSELSVGYGTMYGDLAGGLSVLGDCYKLQVYALAQDFNAETEVIPFNILKKRPSAELRPGQYDSQSLPDYDKLDPILYQYMDRNLQPSEIVKMGYDSGLLDTVLKLINNNEFKRHQFCPILSISSKAFGPGRKIPIVAKL